MKKQHIILSALFVGSLALVGCSDGDKGETTETKTETATAAEAAKPDEAKDAYAAEAAKAITAENAESEADKLEAELMKDLEADEG
jgi:outer membrane murein-binding lipoprotein Lpp